MKRLFFLIPFLAGQLFGYESRQTGVIRSEVLRSENRLKDLNTRRDALRAEAMEVLVSAELLGEAAADAEFKKAGVDIMGMVNLNWTVANMCLMITGAVKTFLASVTSEVAGNVVVQYQFFGDVTLPSGDLPAPAREALDAILPLVVQDTEKEAAEARKDINIVSDKLMGAYDKGSFNYKHILFRNYQKYLSREEARLRSRFSELKSALEGIKTDSDKESGYLDARKKLLDEQKKTDELVAQNKAEVARQEAEEEKRNREKMERLPKGPGPAGEGADAIDLSPELNDMREAGRGLRRGTLSRQGYQKVREGALSRASSKTNRVFTPPKKMTGEEASQWVKRQREAADKKQQSFFENIESLEKSLREDRDKLNKSIVDEAARGLRAAAFDEPAFAQKISDGQPRSEAGASWSPPDLAAGQDGHRELRSAEEALKAVDAALEAAPRVVKHRRDLRRYFDAADKEYNERQLSAARAANEVIQKTNEKVKEHLEFLLYEVGSDPSYAFRPEVDEPRHFTRSRDWDGEMKTLEEQTAALHRDRELILQGTDALAAFRKKGDAFADRLTATRQTGLGNVQGRLRAFLALKNAVRPGLESEWRVETEDIARKLEGLSAGSIAQELALRRNEAEALQTEARNYGALFAGIKPLNDAFASLAEGYGQSAGMLSREIEAAKTPPDQESPEDPSLTKLLSDARTLLAEYRSEETTMREDLAKAAAAAESLAGAFEASAARNPGGLAEDPALSAFFTKGGRPTLRNDKVQEAINRPLNRLKNGSYFSDGSRPYLPSADILDLRRRLSEAQYRILNAAREAGNGYEPGRIARLLIEGKTFEPGSAYSPLTLFKKGRSSDDLALEGALEDPARVKDIEVSLDGGTTWRGNLFKISGDRFTGKVGLRPGEETELKLRAVAPRGDETNPFPGPGRGIRIVYSTDDPEADLREAVGDLFRAYEDESSFSFMRLVSDAFSGNRDNLEAAVKRDFLAHDSVRYRPMIDRATINPDRTMAAVDLHWQRSWFNVSSSRNETASGNGVFRMVKERNKWRLLSLSGTPVFGLTADTPLESAGGGGLPARTGKAGNHSTGGHGYSFVQGGTALLMPDLDYFGTLGGLYGYNGLYDMGAGSLDSVTEAPVAGYSSSGEPAVPGHVYAIRCDDGTYAKFRLTNVSDAEVSFEWTRQPNGSRSFR